MSDLATCSQPPPAPAASILDRLRSREDILGAYFCIAVLLAPSGIIEFLLCVGYPQLIDSLWPQRRKDRRTLT